VTGEQPLPALAGANTVLTDADSATVTGRADPIKRITDLEDAICFYQLKGEITMAIKSKARHYLTLRSIKREIAARRDVAFWLDKAYTHLDNGLLDEADIAEVEALAQAYYDAVDAETVQDGNATNEQIQNPLYEEENQ
jgi:hypothetical protein